MEIFIAVVFVICVVWINETLEEIRDAIRNQHDRYVPAYRSGPALGARPRRKHRGRAV